MKLLASTSLLILPMVCNAATPTYNHDIAPILYKNCVTCHRPGEVAPFPLLTYNETAKRASLLATVAAKRYMPPWKAEPGYGHFQDERRLTDAEISTIAAWAQKGAPEGHPNDKPTPAVFASGWQSGKPDQVLTMDRLFQIPADGQDIFQCFVLPMHSDVDRFVKTVEFRPGNPRVVHHALFFLDTSREARKLDAATPEPGYPCFGGPQILPTGGLGGWAPGAVARPLPEGVAQQVSKDSDLVIQIHYHSSGKPETDQSSIGLTYGESPQKGLTTILMGSHDIDLQPGDSHKVVTDSLLLPADITLIGITPHAHLLCKEMKVDAQLPGGQKEPLIWIKDWDFNWQGQYRYSDPVKLPKGTRISMQYVYDNSSGNPHNPSNPPKHVTFGEQTTDEMAFLFLQIELPHPEDVPIVRRELILARLKQFLLEGGSPAGIRLQTMERLRSVAPRFDTNHDGKLDEHEAAPLLEIIAKRLEEH